MNSYNSYSQPLLVPDGFMNYLNLSKHIFPQQWEFLATARGIYSRDADNLQDYKERQIFMVLLNLQRLANFCTLKHWAMVISNIYSVLWMGGEGNSVPRYLVSRNHHYKDNERLILQEANIESCRVISFVTCV